MNDNSLRRELQSHKVGGLNEQIDIVVIDEPGHGGAHHLYEIYGDDPSCFSAAIYFQNGTVRDEGINGITNEVLLALVQDRLECFQKGDYACRENAIALTHVQDALHWLHHRTRERLARGVEGTMQK